MGAGEAAAMAGFAFAAGTAQALTGFGFALVIVPPLTVALGPRDAVVVASLLGCGLNSARLVRTHHHVAWATAARFVAGSFIGLPVGLAVLEGLDERVLQAVIALTVLAFALLIVRGSHLAWTGAGTDVGAGVVSGVCSTATGMSGPPLVVTLHGRAVEPDSFRATLAATFFATGLLTLGLFALAGRLTGDRVEQALVGAPGLAVGFGIGELLFARIDRERFRRLVVGMLFVSAAVALATLPLR
jgi:uncharacterized membrane protein YfcA